MTCILGLIDSGKVYIAGDSCLSDNDSISILRQPKVWTSTLPQGRKKSEPRVTFAFGGAGDSRACDVVAATFVPPRPPLRGDLYHYMADQFMTELRTKLQAHGALATEREGTLGLQSWWGELLVGVRNQLFVVGTTFEVWSSTDDFEAIGCGDFARAALCVLSSSKATPQNKLLAALKIAAKHSPFVSPPFKIVST